jgi:hypothetical protein
MSDVISLALATGAFVVAVLSLYLGNLRRADVEMIVLSHRPIQLGSQKRRDEGPPERGEIRVPVAVINSGARPGVLTGLDVKRSRGPFFEIEGCTPEPNFRDGELGARALLSGESAVIIASVATRFPDEAVGAWRTGAFRSFDIVLSYSYLKGKKVRPTSTRKLTVRVPVDQIVWKP